MFYLMSHSTHFIYGYMKEGNVLFNDALNIFYLQLYEGRKCFISQRTQHILFTVIWKEGNVLFNDALNTFYLRLYGIRYMVNDHSDSERIPTVTTFLISSKVFFI